MTTLRSLLALVTALPALALAQIQYEGADREKMLAEGAKK